MDLSTCGTCKFGHPIANDLTKVECRGFCRQLIVVPQPGGLAILGQYPQQERADPACHAYQAKLVLDATIHQ